MAVASTLKPKDAPKATMVSKATPSNVTKKVFFENVTEEEVHMLRVEEDDELISAVYAQSMSDMNTVLAWDSGTCTNVAGDVRVATTNVRPNLTGKVAVGVGGKRHITAIADSEVFGEPDFILLSQDCGGGPRRDVPNLLSVSKTAQSQSGKPKEGFIFTATGAVRMVLTNDDYKTLACMTDKAEKEGRLKGSAVLRNGLYEQDFSVQKKTI